MTKLMPIPFAPINCLTNYKYQSGSLLCDLFENKMADILKCMNFSAILNFGKMEIKLIVEFENMFLWKETE